MELSKDILFVGAGSNRKGRCCCGRHQDLDEPILSNNTLHEILGPAGNFCGPLNTHLIRDQEKIISTLKQRNSVLEHVIRQVLPDDVYNAVGLDVDPSGKSLIEAILKLKGETDGK